MDFTRKYIVITGASSGIGEALALAFAAQKARLVLAARNTEKLEALKAKCLQQTDEVHVVLLDLGNNNSIDAAAENIITLVPGIDVLVNNAGISQREKATDTNSEVEERIMQVNYAGPVRLTKRLHKHFTTDSCITIISSMVGLFGFKLRSSYSASKHALHGYFESMSLEDENPHILIVCPGRVNTPISLSALHGQGQPHGKIDEFQQKGISADICAAKILKGISSRKKMMIIAREERLLHYMRRVSPALFHFVSKRVKPV